MPERTKLAGLEALLPLDRAGGGLGAQLTGALREAIRGGRIAAGTRLPSTRDLAADLRVSRGVAVEAYAQLVAEGMLVARRGAGTRVAETPRGAPPTATRPPPPRRAVTPLRPGVPDLGMFPRTAWRRAYEQALATVPDAALDYGDPAGVPQARTALAAHLGRVRAAAVTPTGLVVTAGVAQALALLATVLRGRGIDRIGVEDPGSASLRDHVVAQGLRVVPVPVDADGLDTAALDGLRAVLVTPAHQFPTGVLLSPRRRAELVAWARRVDGLVVEDDYDAEFRYDRDPVGCVQGLAPDVVALVGSVSKSLAPALRLGWLAVPPADATAVAEAKAAADLGGPALEQLAFARLLDDGGYDRHLRRVRRTQRHRRDAVVAALARYLPAARVSGIAAGLHLVAELPPGTDDRALARRAADAGLGPLALTDLRLAHPGPPGLVLGYAAHSPDQLTTAVQRLAGLSQLDQF